MEDPREHDRAPEPEAAEPEAVTSDGSLVRAAPGLARLAAGAGVRTAGWAVSSYVRASSRLVRAALSGESLAELLDDAGAAVREELRRTLGIEDIEQRIGGFAAQRLGGRQRSASDDGGTSPGSLRERGAELLARSADVDEEEEIHPAYDRILTQLAPDEARVLRLLAREGPQAAVDVRTWRPLDVGSQMVAPGLSMIGGRAGCRRIERLPAYLNNLFRLGLIWFSREIVDDPTAYQLLEAQPDVMEAMRKAGRGRTVRRSVQLTPFGQDFCETCLPLGDTEFNTGEFEAIRAEMTSEGRARTEGRSGDRPS